MSTDMRFSPQEIELFKHMIGKQFDRYQCDSFIYSPMVYGIVGIIIDGIPYKLTSLFERAERFYHADDTARFHIQQADEGEIKTYMDEGDMIETPVVSKIVSIDIINDHQTLEHEGEIRSLDCSVGVIFHLEDAREISFEIKTWFSEMITIEKGYNLIDKITSTDDFLEEWESCAGYTAKCTREVITLQ